MGPHCVDIVPAYAYPKILTPNVCNAFLKFNCDHNSTSSEFRLCCLYVIMTRCDLCAVYVAFSKRICSPRRRVDPEGQLNLPDPNALTFCGFNNALEAFVG